ncbi:phosphodiesterase [Brevibacillus gelatini]|uniref:Phosphodiesterase n=1 Tax=Brevibacillus gelatini TaxID=1655277 RepID=A0A3M8AQQ2_9BACL|nr:GGDEF domain-containing phosphodiesterase [Brevibacillus gelatini]RNB53501.1 phosphodiesterase [Brevibacillus gelatini]
MLHWMKKAAQMFAPDDNPILSKQLELFLEQISEAVDVVDSDGRIIWVNAAFEALYGWKKENLLGSELPIIPSNCRKELDSLHKLVQEGQRIIGYQTSREHLDGTLIPIELTVFPLIDRAGTICGRVAISKKVTEQKRSYHEVSPLDPLTQLLNRMEFMKVAQKVLDNGKGIKQKLGVAILNLDRFTLINHTFGQAVGDQLLKEVGGRLKKMSGAEMVLARAGGDEFILLFKNITTHDNLVKSIQNIHAGLQKPFGNFQNGTIAITASMGVSVYPRDGRNLDLLIQKAYIALHASKKAGKNTFHFYTRKLGNVFCEHFLLGQDLRIGFESNELEVHYQPMAEMATGAVCGLEALVRWRHPQKGLIPPSKFIPIAEEIGIIDSIGLWILRRACLDIKQIQMRSKKGLKVAVNLSAIQFQNKNFPRQVQKILRDTNVDGRFLELEITESAVIKDAEHTIQILKELKAMGIQISIDDFGTGYSSLDYLKRFPLNNVKIDKSFIQRMDAEDVIIVTGIIKIAQHLQLRVIGEGVESLEHLEFLREHNCDLYQGYLLSKPLPFENICKLLEERSSLEHEINLEEWRSAE